MVENKIDGEQNGMAKVEKIKRWSPVWIIPIVTALIGAWILFYHYSNQGPEVTLITTTAEGIEGGKTAIKSRNVDVGRVESVTLSDNLQQVIIKARLNTGMEKMLRGDSVFWVVKPQIGREGVSGLSTLLSGAYIQLQPGNKGDEKAEYTLDDSPPLASPDAKGIRVILESERSGQLNPGDPVLFRGFQVGTVETSHFDPKARNIKYQLFIRAPYDTLITDNVRFWKDSGVNFDMSAQGMRVEMGSLATLLSGGVSFDIPSGWDKGNDAKTGDSYKLFDDQKSIQESLYTRHMDYLLFFSDSVRGLQPGAPVEFRGIRLGTVAEVPYAIRGMKQQIESDYRIPVMIRIEPDRFEKLLGNNFDVNEHLNTGIANGLRASMKSANLLTGLMYIDLDFYPKEKAWTGPAEMQGIKVLPTVSGGFAQIQQKLMITLDKINALPIEPMLREATSTLAESKKTMKATQRTLDSLNAIVSSKEMKALPQDMQQTLIQLNRSLKGFQPGSPAYNNLVGDMQSLDKTLRELQPVLKTLNQKSNALIFSAPGQDDPQPKKAK
ncbi:intermembrane transport protein PqiB [Ewingella sp. S1.OA.A_B6]